MEILILLNDEMGEYSVVGMDANNWSVDTSESEDDDSLLDMLDDMMKSNSESENDNGYQDKKEMDTKPPTSEDKDYEGSIELKMDNDVVNINNEKSNAATTQSE